MFKKKLNLSALANKPLEQENQTSTQEDTSILNEDKTNLINYNYEEIVVKNDEKSIIENEENISENIEIPKIDESEIKSEEIINDEEVKEDTIEYNYETILEDTKNEENILENIEIPKTNESEIKSEEIINDEEVKEDTKIESKKKTKKSKKVIYNYEEVVVELPTPETEEEKEKRYDEMISKVEVKKSEFDYDKEEKIELFGNYQSDLEIIVDKIEGKNDNNEKNLENSEKNDNINSEVIKNTSEEEIIIRKPINRKVIAIISILVLLSAVIGSIFYFLNDIKSLIKREKIDEIIVDGEISNSGNIIEEEISNSGATNEQIMEEVLTNSGISNLVDEEIKEEVETYIEEIKDKNLELTPEQIKKKVNDKIIEIYLKKTMLK